MSKIFFKFFGHSLLVIYLFIIGCDADLDVITNLEPVPVVYCLLMPDDNLYDLYLSKSFSGLENAYQLASDPHRIFVADPLITLDLLQDGYSLWASGYLLCDKPKGIGLFPSLPGGCFTPIKSTRILHPGGELFDDANYYRIVIRSPEFEQTIFSTIPILEMPEVYEPSKNDKNLNLYGQDHFKIKIKVNSMVDYCDIKIDFHYEEMASRLTTKTVNFVLRKDALIVEDEIYSVVDAEKFFKSLAIAVPDVADLEYRRVKGFDLVLLFSDQYFKNWIDSYTISSDVGGVPIGNISNGIGFFSVVRSKRMNDFLFNQQTLDSLAHGQFTKHLNFVQW